ncbi:hypothetical protein RchiOBHm_Chr5g0047911 [Rosa chinensis]|uniref:Uncharacterized protein n=1 Tax=Rosa chinensis TaxID=74649 RepID=A0A2P6QEI0_ROSCH|nr:hypothetical protein RchiOBHm_Chr5g0047911 [Rosa chinensis]
MAKTESLVALVRRHPHDDDGSLLSRSEMGVAGWAMVILVRSSQWKMRRLYILSSQAKSMASSRRSWWWVGVPWQITRPWLRVLQYLSQIRSISTILGGSGFGLLGTIFKGWINLRR